MLQDKKNPHKMKKECMYTCTYTSMQHIQAFIYNLQLSLNH
jgi:hypothetical protein